MEVRFIKIPKTRNSGREVVLDLVMRRNPKELKYKLFYALSITYLPNFFSLNYKKTPSNKSQLLNFRACLKYDLF